MEQLFTSGLRRRRPNATSLFRGAGQLQEDANCALRFYRTMFRWGRASQGKVKGRNGTALTGGKAALATGKERGKMGMECGRM